MRDVIIIDLETKKIANSYDIIHMMQLNYDLGYE